MATTVRRGYRYVVRKENGTWPPRHHNGLDPGLVGPRAFEHPAVKEWWMWLLREYRPRASVALVTPCSSVKPYTRSPTSRKIRGLLRRLGLWSAEESRPEGIEWLYLSDLLLLVPYERAETYPACCYELAPDEVLRRPLIAYTVARVLSTVVERLMEHGLERLIVYLPRKHMELWSMARERAAKWPEETIVRFSIFGLGGLREALEPLRHVPPLQELL
ncbi:DUF5591 domain-containing protein [Pyrodictium delaneyi]|uniref:DUF5591 domain-containing protein n=1 Tax=Pyrodictium delaneyi TaxID=1273541 RepID=UPI00214D5FF2|nr:DUF5591 domain-containing protein [Pyrodictium delaneyi]